MREGCVDIWEKNAAGCWVCVTTNGIVKSDGTAVMGAGVALHAAQRYPELPRLLAGYLQKYGNRAFVFPQWRLITFPTKHHYSQDSSIDLIRTSCGQLMAIIGKYGIDQVFLPRPGCHNGRLSWDVVRTEIGPLLDDRVTVCDFSGVSRAALLVPDGGQLDLFGAGVAEEPSRAALPAEQYVNHSGGAYGADTEWDVIGRRFGVTDHRHYREQGNPQLSKRLREAGVKAVLLKPSELERGYALLEKVYDTHFERGLANNLKARNFFQVDNAEAVFAIGFLKGLKAVKGGTDAAVQMGISQEKPVHVFDLKSAAWHHWDDSRFVPCPVPVLTPHFAGIGTRDIENYQVMKEGSWTTRPQYVGDALAQVARDAIEAVYRKTFG